MTTTSSSLPMAELAVIGGSGFYELLTDAERIVLDTPYGEPSDAITVGEVGGRKVAFLPRHGRGHTLPPHRINYRANIWALHQLGVQQILAPCAVGSLEPELGPGSVVVPDQLVDRTSGRIQTFYEEGAIHVSFADPYCGYGRAAVLKAAASTGTRARNGGTMVVVAGPRFSTRAESQWFAAAGWSIVNMTGHPEAVLARELGICYTSVALVTDHDAGIDAAGSVAQEEVFKVFAANNERLRTLILDALRELPQRRVCRCAGTGDGPILPAASTTASVVPQS